MDINQWNFTDTELVCGIDEAGRGPLAGPVTAAAVILPREFPHHILRDSKKLSEKQRWQIAYIIRSRALSYACGWSWPAEIDQVNIHRATLIAMQRALFSIKPDPALILVDGAFKPVAWDNCHAIVKGDTFVPSIQAASIIAKTTRDLWMSRYSRIESAYAFAQHKGYPTRLHKELLNQYGLCPIHRRSFKF